MFRRRYNALLAQKLIDAFRKRKMEGFYCETKEEALRKVLEWIPENSVVSCGGSATLRDIGLTEKLQSGPYVFLDPKTAQGVQAMEKVAHDALQADYYLMSANAVALSGELVNMDAIGNRVSALAYGPENVIVVAGLNKVEPTLDAAIHRVRTKAAQLSLLMFRQDYASFDELAEAAEGIGNHLVITGGSVKKNRVRIILVGESVGA